MHITSITCLIYTALGLKLLSDIYHFIASEPEIPAITFAECCSLNTNLKVIMNNLRFFLCSYESQIILKPDNYFWLNISQIFCVCMYYNMT